MYCMSTPYFLFGGNIDNISTPINPPYFFPRFMQLFKYTCIESIRRTLINDEDASKFPLHFSKNIIQEICTRNKLQV